MEWGGGGRALEIEAHTDDSVESSWVTWLGMERRLEGTGRCNDLDIFTSVQHMYVRVVQDKFRLLSYGCNMDNEK